MKKTYLKPNAEAHNVHYVLMDGSGDIGGKPSDFSNKYESSSSTLGWEEDETETK